MTRPFMFIMTGSLGKFSYSEALADYVAPATGTFVGAYQIELPRTRFQPAYVARTGTVWTVASGGALQSALNAAQPGDWVVLSSGVVYPGKLVLPPKSGSNHNPIYVVNSAIYSGTFAYPVGTRATSSVGQAIIRDPTGLDTVPLLQTSGTQSSGWRFSGITFDYPTVGSVTQYSTFILLGDPAEPVLANYPSNFVFDRCRVLGQPLLSMRSGIWINASNVMVSDSQFLDQGAIVPTSDSQGVRIWHASQNVLITNNEIAGATESAVVGGMDGNPFPPTKMANDVTIERGWHHHLDYQNPLHPSWNSQSYNTKNLGEQKGGYRILWQNLVLSNHLGQDQQHPLTIKGNLGSSQAIQNVHDVVMRNIKFVDCMAGLFVRGFDDNPNSGGLQRVGLFNSAMYGARDTVTISPRILDYEGFLRNVELDRITMLLTGGNASIAVTQYVSGEIKANIRITNSILGAYYGIGIPGGTGPGGTGGPWYGLDDQNISGEHIINNNIIVSPANTNPYAAFGTNTVVTASVGVGFTSYNNLSTDNLILSGSSPFKGTGPGGTDPGCNIPALNIGTIGCISGIWDSIPTTITIQAERWVTGSGATLLALGVPLQQGQLFSSSIASASVWLTGSEIPVYAECLGVWSDGSARSLYIQASQPLAYGTPVKGDVRFDIGFTQARRTFVETSGTFVNATGSTWVSGGLPQGGIVPTSASHLCAAVLHGPLVPQATQPVFSGSATTDFALTQMYVSTSLAQVGFPHALANYNRPTAMFHLWARTADSQYLRSALSNASAYRTGYWAPNNFALPETQNTIDSLVQYGLLVRDTTALTTWTVLRAEDFGTAYTPRSSVFNWNNYDTNAGRLNSLLLGQLGAGLQITGKDRVSTGLTWQQHTDAWLAKAITSPFWNGNAWTVSGFESNGTTPKRVVYPYMCAMMCDQIIQLSRLVPTSTDLTNALNAVSTCLNWIRNNMQTVSATGTVCFNYSSAPLYDSGGGTLAGYPDPAVDLNGFLAHLYAWKAWRENSAVDALMARTLFATIGFTPRDGITGPYIVNDKQWDESFHRSQLTLAYLQLAGI